MNSITTWNNEGTTANSRLETVDGNSRYEAFHDCYNTYRERLVESIAGIMKNRDIAEDVTATAFETALANLARFRGTSSLYTWIRAIAMNEARHWLQRNRTVSLDAIQDALPTEREPDFMMTQLERSECCVTLRKALRQMPTRRTYLGDWARDSKGAAILTFLASRGHTHFDTGDNPLEARCLKNCRPL